MELTALLPSGSICFAKPIQVLLNMHNPHVKSNKFFLISEWDYVINDFIHL